MRRPIAAASVVSVWLAALLLGGCAGRAEAPATGSYPALGAVETVESEADVVRPIDSYMPSSEKLLALAALYESAINDCLTSKGLLEQFTYPQPEELGAFIASGVDDRVARSSLWGFFDTQTAEHFGYQRANSSGSINIPPLSEEGTAACLANPQGLPDPLLLINEWALPDGGPPVPAEDQRYVASVRDWEECMAEKGFDFGTPIDAISEFVGESPASPRQIATSTADIACKVSTNLVGVGLAVQSAYDEKYIASNLAALEALKSQIDGATSASASG